MVSLSEKGSFGEVDHVDVCSRSPSMLFFARQIWPPSLWHRAQASRTLPVCSAARWTGMEGMAKAHMAHTTHPSELLAQIPKDCVWPILTVYIS